MEDNVSNTISVTGIPKTATMEQVIEIEMQPCLLHYLFLNHTVFLIGIDRHSLLILKCFADSWCFCSS